MRQAFSVFLIAVLVNGLVFGIAYFGAVSAQSSAVTPSVPDYTLDT
jgi:hypothetical protein